MKRVLMVCYDFPPSPVGIWRTLKFCRYMPEFGWQPAILTVKNVRTPRHDDGPLSELPPGTEIRRTGSLDPSRLAYLAGAFRDRFRGRDPSAPGPRKAVNQRGRAFLDWCRAWLLLPDDRSGWIPFATRAGERWLREAKFDAVYSTTFPHSAHVVGERLARRSGLPYLADFRDIWIGNYYFYKPATAWHDRRQRAQEARVVRTAARVVSCTAPITADFLARYPQESAGKFATITNGFDDGDFGEAVGGEGHSSDNFNRRPTTDDRRPHFTITYAGTMYGQTSPEAFLSGVQRLLAAEPVWREALRLRFVGTMIEPYERMIDGFGLRDITTVDPYLAHGEALRAMAAADALLLLVADVPGSHIMLTQKVFEYAAARRPIIGIVPNGAARDFLEEIGEGPIVAPGDAAGVAAAAGAMLRAWRERGRIELAPNPALAKYHRRELTRSLCAHLDAISGGR